MPRNNFLFPNAIYLLPYTGAGSGIQCALNEDNRLNESLHEFVITIARNSDSNSDTDLGTKDMDSDTFSLDSDTKSGDLDTNSDIFSLDSDTKSSDLNTFKRIKLNNKQKDVVNYCSVPRNSKEILERVGVSYHSKNIERYINALVDAGYMEMTNPENPNASNQKYRKKIKK